jgi:2-polyprenyl-6-methoxyphenol hydroxylase-like FAD-dependent oxidoreductase
MTTHHTRAIVIGGGIAGPAVSLFLQRGGIEPRVFEAYPRPTAIGGGFQIAPNGMRVLAALGLADEVAANGVPSSRFVFRNQRGRTIGRIDLSASGPGVTILRSAFHKILLDETARRGVHVSYGKRLRAIDQSASGVVARFDDGSAESGDLLIASDGVHSRTRAILLPAHARPRYTGVLGIGGFAELAAGDLPDPRDEQQLNFTMGARLQCGYALMSAAPPRWGWWTHLPQEAELARADLMAVPDSELRARALSAFRGWHAPIEALIASTPQVMRTAIYDVPPLPAWHAGRVMLLGDAAHAMSPAGGQGASLALEDAMMVGQWLASHDGSVPEVFARVESLLRPRAERMVRQAADNDRRQLNELGAAGRWMRDRIFPLIAPLIGRELQRHYAGLPRGAASAA